MWVVGRLMSLLGKTLPWSQCQSELGSYVRNKKGLQCVSVELTLSFVSLTWQRIRGETRKVQFVSPLLQSVVYIFRYRDIAHDSLCRLVWAPCQGPSPTVAINKTKRHGNNMVTGQDKLVIPYNNETMELRLLPSCGSARSSFQSLRMLN